MLDLPQTWCITKVALAGIESEARRSDTATALARRAEIEKHAATMRKGTKTGSKGRLALIPVYGVITQRGSWFSFTSVMRLQAELHEAISDPVVEAVLLDFDSPGGTVAGIEEFANDVFKARETKPVYAIANSLAASAAYWIASAASRLYAAPASEVGSIGVFSRHVDFSKLNEKAGIVPSYISAGEFKVEGNPDEPLSVEARGAIQRSVNEVHHDFLRGVARNRGVQVSVVREHFGKGRTVGARDALSVGMVDGIGVLEEVYSKARNATSIDRRRASWLVNKAQRLGTR